MISPVSGGERRTEFCDLIVMAALELGDLRGESAKRCAVGVGRRARRRRVGTWGLLVVAQLADAG